MRCRHALFALLSALVLAAPALADEIIFRNGDHLRGKLLKAEGGKLTFKPDVAGEITIDMKDVKSFSTDEPIKLKLTDGSVLQQQVKASDTEGAITTTAGALPEQTVAIADISTINFNEKWTGNFFVGGTITRGNSETESLDARASLTKRSDLDRILVEAGYLFAKQEDPDTGEDITGADNWFVFGKYDYFLTRKLYAYGSTRIERDRIAELDLRLTPSVGVGYQWFETPNFELRTEAGLAYVYEDFATGDSNEYAAARLAYGVKYKFNDRVSVFHNLEYLPSLEDPAEFNLNADTGIRASLTKKMYSEFKIEWKHDSEPAPTAEKNDLRFILGVGLEI